MDSPDPTDRFGQAIRATPAPAPQPRRLRALVAMDRGSGSIEPSELLARLLPPGSRVRILTVVSHQAPPESRGHRLGESGEAARPVAPQSEALSNARRILETAGAQVSATHRFGHPADEILNEASDWGADIVLVGHHNGLARWFLGSVAESIVKRSPIPVLVVPQLTSARRKPTENRPATMALQARLPA